MANSDDTVAERPRSGAARMSRAGIEQGHGDQEDPPGRRLVAPDARRAR